MPNSSSQPATRSDGQGRNRVGPGRITTDPPAAFSTDSSPADSRAIRLEQISKSYRHVAAVRSLSLDVRQGEIFGFLGLNGAGKTTTIRIILDLVRPTSGSAYVFGLSCRDHGIAVRSQIGYLPGELGFYGDMTGEATLDVLARLQERAIDRVRQRQLVDRMQLSSRDLRRRVREYSTGMKRKLGIVQAFQSDPPLLILDEPTEGLDPLMQDAFYDLLAATKRQGRTVFMSSHVLSEVEHVCDRIGLIRRGELVLASTVAEVRSMAARHIRVLFSADVDGNLLPGGLTDTCETVNRTPREWTLRVRGPLGPLFAVITQLPVDDVEVREPHLEEVLKAYYKDEVFD